VSVRNCYFSGNKFGIYIDSNNADIWDVDTCGFGLYAYDVYQIGVYLYNSGYFTFRNCSAGGSSAAALATSWLTIKDSDTVIIDNCQSEGDAYHTFIDVEVGGSSNGTAPIIMRGCAVDADIYLRRTCHFISIGNKYGGYVTYGNVRATAAGVKIDSIGDTSYAGDNSQGFILTNGATIQNALPYGVNNVLGLGATWTPAATGFDYAGSGTETITGTYCRVGQIVYFSITIAYTETKTSACTSGDYINAPITPSVPGTCAAVNSDFGIYGSGLVLTDGKIYPPAWTAFGTAGKYIVITGSYLA
jgi:hypothetical protein